MWPAMLIGAVFLPLRFVTPMVFPGYEGFAVAILSGLMGSALLALWWLAFSRASASDRSFATLTTVVLLSLVMLLNHESMRFMWGVYYALPLIGLVLLIALAQANRSGRGLHRKTFLIGVAVVLAPWLAIRLEGLTGEHRFQFEGRWSTDEAIDQVGHVVVQPKDFEPEDSPFPRSLDIEASWPGFRGPNRDGRINGLEIGTNWTERPAPGPLASLHR